MQRAAVGLLRWMTLSIVSYLGRKLSRLQSKCSWPLATCTASRDLAALWMETVFRNMEWLNPTAQQEQIGDDSGLSTETWSRILGGKSFCSHGIQYGVAFSGQDLLGTGSCGILGVLEGEDMQSIVELRLEHTKFQTWQNMTILHSGSVWTTRTLKSQQSA